MTEASQLKVGERFQLLPGTGGYYGPREQWFEVTEITPTGYKIKMVDTKK